MAAFQTFFHGGMGPLELACLKSFADHGHEVSIYSYDHIATPSFCRAVNAAEILPKNRLFVYQTGFGAGSVSAFSNMFRYALLLRRGGCWIDTDVFCLSADWPPQNVLAGWQDTELINSAVLRLPSRHDAAALALERCIALQANVVWGETGPNLLTEVFQGLGLESEALPPGAFYPVHWTHWLDPLDPAKTELVRAKSAGAFAIHLWNELLRYGGVQKVVAPPPRSFLWELLKRHDLLRHFAEGNERTWQRQIEMNRAA